MVLDKRRARGLIESSRGFRTCMSLLAEDNGQLFSDVRRLVKNYADWLSLFALTVCLRPR